MEEWQNNKKTETGKGIQRKPKALILPVQNRKKKTTRKKTKWEPKQNLPKRRKGESPSSNRKKNKRENYYKTANYNDPSNPSTHQGGEKKAAALCQKPQTGGVKSITRSVRQEEEEEVGVEEAADGNGEGMG